MNPYYYNAFEKGADFRLNQTLCTILRQKHIPADNTVILCIGTEEAIAVVTQTNDRSQKVTMVYGHEKSMKHKLRFNVEVGDVLKINFISDTNGKLRLLSARRSTLLSNLSYVKEAEGMIQKRDTQPFAG